MPFFPDVKKGDIFRPNLVLDNEVRHRLNELNGYTGGTPNPATTKAVTLPVVCLTQDIPAGTAVTFTGFHDADGTTCTVTPCTNADDLWGVIRTDIPKNTIGSAAVSGLVRIVIPSAASGKYATPTTTGFTLSDDTGAPVIARDETAALILLGGGAAAPQDTAAKGPFDTKIITENGIRKIRLFNSLSPDSDIAGLVYVGNHTGYQIPSQNFEINNSTGTLYITATYESSYNIRAEFAHQDPGNTSGRWTRSIARIAFDAYGRIKLYKQSELANMTISDRWVV